MSDHKLSRRAFLSQAGLGVALVPSPSPPSRAWIIVELGWETNDEFSYSLGEYHQAHLYYDRAAADAECQRLCETFFSSQTPAEFEVDWASYDLERETEFDQLAVTWDELREAGFPDPYYVTELTVPGGDSP